MSTPETSAVIFCEQIRFETSGQFSVMGVWPPLVEVDEFPFSESIALLVVNKDMTRPTLMELVLRSGSGAEFGRASFQTGVPTEAEGLVSFLPLPPRRITLSSPDTLEVVIRLDGGEPKVVGMMRLVLDPESEHASPEVTPLPNLL